MHLVVDLFVCLCWVGGRWGRRFVAYLSPIFWFVGKSKYGVLWENRER